jgi:hypothetical protein
MLTIVKGEGQPLVEKKLRQVHHGRNAQDHKYKSRQ